MTMAPKCYLAEPRGFCLGVKNALKSLDDILEAHGAPVYVLNPIVHNEFVIKAYQDRGVVFVESLEQADVARPLAISAHGIAKGIEREIEDKGFLKYDLTCPFVKKLHTKVVRNSAEGRQTILIGTEAGHHENQGTIGQAPKNDVLFLKDNATDKDIDILAGLVRDADKLSYVTQTTLSQEAIAPVIKSLKDKFPRLSDNGTDICYATSERQEAVKKLVADHDLDLVLVVGSPHSSNTKKLKEIALFQTRYLHKKAQVIAVESVKDLTHYDLSFASHIGITSGASTPEPLVQEIIECLKKGKP